MSGDRDALPEWELTLHAPGPEQTQTVGARLGRQLRRGDLLVLTGELGAGKTTFTQGLGAGLGVREGIISPTFVLVRIHPNLPDGPNPGGPDLVHVDAYRLGSAGEIDDIDLENTLDSSVTVIEWGRDRVEHLAQSRLEITLTRIAEDDSARDTTAGDALAGLDFAEQDEQPRVITVTGYGPRWSDSQPVLGVD